MTPKMPLLKGILLLVSMLLAILKSNSQTLQLEVLQNVPYSNLAGGTQISPNNAWSEINAGSIALPFPFKSFANAELTDLYIEFYGIDISDGVNYLTLYPLFSENDDDYRDKNYDPMLTPEENELRPAQSKVSYLFEGNPGNRVLKIEYQNVQFWEKSAENDSVNFQVWLFEENSMIEFHFGNIFIADPEAVFGPSGPVVVLIEEKEEEQQLNLLYQYFLEGDCQNPILVEDNVPGPIRHYISGIPSNGTVYRFGRPSSSSVNDELMNTLLVFPNPNSTGIYAIDEKAGTVIVTDVLGREILKTTLPGVIDISKSPAGVYFYLLQVNGKSYSGRLIKE